MQMIDTDRILSTLSKPPGQRKLIFKMTTVLSIKQCSAMLSGCNDCITCVFPEV